MLRSVKFSNNFSNYFFTSSKFSQHFGRKGIKCQYQCRMYSSDKDSKTGGACSDNKNESFKIIPPNETATQPPGPCKTATGMKGGAPSLMDQLPKPSVDCTWEDEQKRNNPRRNIILLTGVILFALSAYTVYKKIFPAFDVPERDKTKMSAPKKTKRPWVISKNPSNSSEIPDEVPYLLIGGGTASFSAFRAIKSRDPKAKVLVIGQEPYYPYMRPPLSKEMYYIEDRSVAKKLKFKQWNGTERSLFYEPDDFYASCLSLNDAENGGVAVARGWSVKKIDPTNCIAYLEDNKKIKYQKCLIATGSRPKNHAVFEDVDKDTSLKISLYRNIFDYEEIEDIIDKGAESITIVGGSFLGSELACALARRGKKQNLKVTQIMKESGNMGKILPEYLSKWTMNKVVKEGVNVISQTSVDDVDLKDDKLLLTLSNGKELITDHVILALGVTPNTDLAASSDLEIDKEQGGYLVNAELEARSNLYVAGDCACFYDAKLGRRRVEHHDHAVVSGRLAGENMTGAGKPYWHQSMFWSDLGPDVGYEAIGVIDSSMSTVGVYAKVTNKDNPKAVKTSDEGDGMRSTSEEEASNSKEDGENKDGENKDGENKDGDEESKEKTDDLDKVQEKDKANSEDYGKGVIFYLRDGIVVGIVLWNVFNRMAIARQVLSDERKFEDLNEVAKLFNIHKD